MTTAFRFHSVRSLCFAVLLAVLVTACGSSTTPSAPSPTAAPGATPDTTPSPNASEAARYRLTFESTWSATTHPVDFPTTAHFSALVGGTHDATASFWRDGGLATNGIRDMAERGRTSPLDDEINAAVRAGSAGAVSTGGQITATPGTVSLEFDIRQRYPLVTFVSMVAPSPDWFVGVSGLPLFENGRWVSERRVELVPWDAGTDGGSTFLSPDRETQPRAPISRIATSPLAPNGAVRPLGTFVFTRIQ
jgi:hypothetical protein